ncbi:hypothetical protein L3X38_023911 [Prunus dulcis]|uniref:Uncharacterized protein n=1 Tax=Prunus dulcis TaxID=3755 RepID=A0AAD4VYS0_PRUDU|nr:hypothetical protein L3X38_023911 [Prunus dulcis]
MIVPQLGEVLCMGSKLLGRGLQWRIGNGDNVRFWKDSWCNDTPLLQQTNLDGIEDVSCTVSAYSKHGWWEIEKLRGVLSDEFIQHIINVPVGCQMLKFGSHLLMHIYREKNYVADRWRSDVDLGLYVFESAPVWMASLLVDHVLGVTRPRLVCAAVAEVQASGVERASRLETDGVDTLSCGYAIRRAHQLPCAHEIAEYRDRGVPIPLDVVHSHWRKLDLINIGNSSHGTTSPGRSQLQRFNMWYEQQGDEKKRQVHMTLEELMNPSSTALIEPKEKLKTKGRLRKVDTSTRRLPSAIEIVEAFIALPKNKPKQSLAASLKIKSKKSAIAVPKKRDMVASNSMLSNPKKFNVCATNVVFYNV